MNLAPCHNKMAAYIARVEVQSLKSVNMLRFLNVYKSKVNLSILKTSTLKVQTRNLSRSAVNYVKKIEETTTGNVTEIRGVFEESERKPHLIPQDNASGCCPLCRLNLDLQHTDVLILSQFVRPDGCVLSRRITGLCGEQQMLIKSLVAQAQKAGLMSNLTPSYSHKDPRKRYGHKKFNRYFDPGITGIKTKEYM